MTDLQTVPMCPVCKKPFLPGQLCLSVPVAYELVQGEKDPNFVHWIPRGDPENPEWIHLSCMPEYVDPEWNEDMYAAMKDQMNREIDEETRSETYNDAYQEAHNDIMQELLEHGDVDQCPDCGYTFRTDGSIPPCPGG